MIRDFIKLVVSLCFIQLVSCDECVRTLGSVCSCTSNGKIFTLQGLNPRLLSATSGQYNFYLDPCGTAGDDTKNEAAKFCQSGETGCQKVGGTSDFPIAGQSFVAHGDPYKNQLVFTYTFVDAETVRTTNLNLKCNFDGGDTPFAYDTEYGPDDKNRFYNFTLQTTQICTVEPSEGISGGSVLLLLLFFFTLVYLAAGILFMKLVRSAVGWEAIPNIEFWKDFPALVKDGVQFTLSGCKAESSYEQI